MEGLRKCKRIESAMTDLEKQSSNGVYFPAIVGQRPRREKRRVSAASESERGPSSMSSVYQQTSPSVLQLPDNIQVHVHVVKVFDQEQYEYIASSPKIIIVPFPFTNFPPFCTRREPSN